MEKKIVGSEENLQKDARPLWFANGIWKTLSNEANKVVENGINVEVQFR